MMTWLREIIQYLRHGRHLFRREEMVSRSKAEEAFQGSIVSALEVRRNADQVRTNADFIKEVLSGH